jgi:hypothetical protein
LSQPVHPFPSLAAVEKVVKDTEIERKA